MNAWAAPQNPFTCPLLFVKSRSGHMASTEIEVKVGENIGELLVCLFVLSIANAMQYK